MTMFAMQRTAADAARYFFREHETEETDEYPEGDERSEPSDTPHHIAILKAASAVLRARDELRAAGYALGTSYRIPGTDITIGDMWRHSR